jgi:N-glycosylase/DNA lyase
MIKSCTLDDIPTKGNKQNLKRIKDIEDFIATGADCCEVVLDDQNPVKVRAALDNAIKKRNYYRDLVFVIQRKNRIFLVRHENKRVKGE